MGITEDFETREHSKNGWIVYFPHDVEQLLTYARSLEAQNEKLRTMLRKHWVSVSEVDGSPYCPECYEQGWDSHTPDCALAKLIGEE